MVGEERVDSGSSTFAFVLGLVVGGIAGVLFAPQSGREMRDRLRDYASKTTDSLRDSSGPARQTINRVAEKGREIAEKGREYVERQSSTVGDAIKAGREAMESERQRNAGG